MGKRKARTYETRQHGTRTILAFAVCGKDSYEDLEKRVRRKIDNNSGPLKSGSYPTSYNLNNGHYVVALTVDHVHAPGAETVLNRLANQTAQKYGTTSHKPQSLTQQELRNYLGKHGVFV
jgi:hypothetical protein